jgi:Arc/MetJ-type ribon-helix-helix transcriptional regulator
MVLLLVIPEGKTMSTVKVAISIDEQLLNRLDHLVKNRVFENRSRAIQEAVNEKISRLDRTRLARECSKLDPAFEKALAEEGMTLEADEWPEY